MEVLAVENSTERQAMRYLEDQAYSSLLNYKEPVRTAEMIAEIGNEQYSTRLLRHVLIASTRFAQIDRKWDLEVRYEDKQRPLERILTDIVQEYGRPMSIAQMANQLSSVYERDASFYEPVAQRLLSDEDKFFRLPDGLYGLKTWLIDAEFDAEDDLVFYNDIDEEEVQLLSLVADDMDWTSPDISALVDGFVDAAGAPVSNKAVCYFRWKALGDKMKPISEFETLFRSGLVWLSDGHWASRAMVAEYGRILDSMAARLSEDAVEEATVAVEKTEATEEAAPVLSLNISERDIEEVLQIVSARGEAKMPLILESIFEISPRDPIYPVAAEGLSDAMKIDPRFTWVGAERWRMADTIPAHVSLIPADLEIPRLQFETADGEQLELELEDEGLEGGLDKEIHNPLVQDVYDQDDIKEADKQAAGTTVRCVVARHHRRLGTFPLCQIPYTFFPGGPQLVQITLIGDDKKGDVWVNRDTGLMYDMGKWYSEDMPESGAVFTLVRTDKPDEFRFEYEGKTDPLAHVSAGRLEELLGLSGEAGSREYSTLDIMNRILEHHRKGIPFVTLHTEVNIVRRTRRRLIASILSSYYAFYVRPKSSAWQYDEKKVDQGFKKAKRKYVRKG